MCIGAYYVVLN